MNKSDSIVKIAGALLRAQRNMGNASKDSKNPFFKSKYADLNSVREVAHPALNAENISILQPMVNVDGKNFVETLLLHESGEWISSLTEIVCSKMSDPQSAGAAISYSRRYGLQSLVSIGAEDNDAEGAMNRVPSKTPALWGSSTTSEVRQGLLTTDNSTIVSADSLINVTGKTNSGNVKGTNVTVTTNAPAGSTKTVHVTAPAKANGSFKKAQAPKAKPASLTKEPSETTERINDDGWDS